MAKDYEDLSMKEILSSIKTDILNSPYNKFDLKKDGGSFEEELNDEDIMEFIDDDENEDESFFDDEPMDLTEILPDDFEENRQSTNHSVDSYDFRDVTKSISDAMQEEKESSKEASIEQKKESAVQEQQTSSKQTRKKAPKSSASSNQNEEIDKFLEMIKSSDKDLSFNTDASSSDTDNSLISRTTENKSLRSIEKILDTKRKIRDEEERAQLRMRTTIDDLALAALTPMLRQWIDQNLNRIVEEVIQKEIEKLIDKASGK